MSEPKAVVLTQECWLEVLTAVDMRKRRLLDVTHTDQSGPVHDLTIASGVISRAANDE